MIAAGATTKASAQRTSGASSSQAARPGRCCALGCAAAKRVASWRILVGCPHSLNFARLRLAARDRLRRSLATLGFEIREQLVDIRRLPADVAEGRELRVAGRVARRVRERVL